MNRHKLNISHLQVFGYAIYVPIASFNCTKMGLQRKLEIYVGYISYSIIKYLEPLTDNQFTARFVDCVFYEIVVSTLGEGKGKEY